MNVTDFKRFHPLVQKLELITPVVSTLQDKQNECSLHSDSLICSKVRMVNTDIFRHIY